MTLLEVVLAAAVLAGLAALASQALARGAWTRRTELLARLHAAATLAALALLLLAFLLTDLSYAYVWDHTHVAYPLAYKVAGLWGGEEGTILLWAALACAFLLPILRRGGHADGLHRRAALFLAAFTTALCAIALLSGGFGATAPESLARAPSGRGLADVLLTPLMVIHPPIQFVAYALMAPMGAYVLAALARPAGTGRDADAWAAPAFAWARAAWLFATLGLGLGALWAYYVLSFGGYWAWDPVETSNLLPWLALTAFLHAGKQFLRHRGHPLAAPLLVFLAFALTLFATFATRSGLWVSVHAFTDPTDRFEPDAPLRLLGIVGVHAPTRLFLGLLTAVVAAGVALFALHHAPRLAAPARRYAQGHAVLLLGLGGAALVDPAAVWSLLFHAAALVPSFALGLGLVGALLLGAPVALVYLSQEESRARRGVEPRTLMGGAVALFAIATGVAFLLNLQVVNRPERLLFDLRAPFLVLPMVALLTVMLALAPLGARGAVALAAAGAVGGAAGWLLVPEHRVLAMSAPLLLAAALAALARLVHVQGRAMPLRLRAAGTLLLLASVAGIVFWSNPPARLGPLAVPWAAGFLGVALGALGLAGALAAFRARGHALALMGAAAAVLTVGYGVGALLALLALVLLLPERGAFQPLAWRREGARVRETGIYLVHLAVILGLLGYAASTYSQQRATFSAVDLDTAGEVGPYAFRLGEPATTLDEDGRLLVLRVPVALEKGGEAAGAATLGFTWERDHYKGDLDVRRHLWEDVYVTPLAFRTADGWVGADAAGAGRVTGEGIEAVTFSVAVLPLMSLVWAGLWMGVLGMAMVLAGAALLRGKAETTRRVPVEEGPRPMTRLR